MSSELTITDRARPQRAEVAERIASAIAGVPGVARLGRGGLVEAATYQGARKISGVVVRSDGIAVHIEVDRLPLPPVVAAVRDAAATALRDASWPGTPDISVIVDNLTVASLPVAVGAR